MILTVQFQLTMKTTLETPLSCEQLRRRHQAAWWRTRRALPVVGVGYPTLDQATIELHQTADDAKQWAAQTCLVADNTTVSDVYLARSRTQTDALTTMTLVVDPIRGPRGYVLNMSHTLMSLDIFKIIQEFMFQLARPENELGIDAIFSRETTSNTTSRLPQSLSHAYALRHQPTPQDLQEAFALHQRSQERWSRSTVGIPLHPDHQHRPNRIHNKTITFEPSEAKTAFRFLKQSGVSLTAAFFACMTSGIAHSFPSTNASPDGAHLLFSGNGRRFVPVTASNGQGPITMPVLPASMWIEDKDVNLRPTSPQGLLRLARVIDEAQNQDLASPHIIAVWDQMGPALAKALEDAYNLPGGPPPPPSVGRPTLTSQGQFKCDLDNRTTTTGTDTTGGADRIRMADFNTGGRSTDPSVCFALNSFRDELRFNLLFDEKFFDQHDVMHMAYVVARLFRRLVGLEPVAVARL